MPAASKYIKVKGFLYRLAAVPFRRLTDDEYGKYVQSLYQDLIGMEPLSGFRHPDIQIFIKRLGKNVSDATLYKNYKKQEDIVDQWAVVHNYMKEVLVDRTVDTIKSGPRVIDSVYSAVDGSPVAYFGTMDILNLSGGFTPAVAVHTSPTDMSGRLRQFPLHHQQILLYAP